MKKNLKENLTIKKIVNTDKIYCNEDYASDLYNMYNGCYNPNDNLGCKDLDCDKIIRATVIGMDLDKIELSLPGGLTVFSEIKKEKLSKKWIYENVKLNSEIDVYIKKISKNDYIASFDKIHQHNIKNNFLKSLDNDEMAYRGKIVDKNRGGFFINIDGVIGYLPGSLAATNKILDFDSMIGKNVIVMVDGYIKETDMFIFSNKKYIKHILPIKIKELNKESNYTGIVTGVTKFGVFIEFDTIYTGLLHVAEMNEVDSLKFNNHAFKINDEVTFNIKEVSKKTNYNNSNNNYNYNIILTQKDYSNEQNEFVNILEELSKKKFKCRFEKIDYFENEAIFNYTHNDKKINIYINKDDVNKFLNKDNLYDIELLNVDFLFHKIYGTIIT